MTGETCGDSVTYSLRRTYPRGYPALEQAITGGLGTNELSKVTDIEVHADRLRPGDASGRAVSEIPFDVNEIMPRGGSFDFMAEHGGQVVFLLDEETGTPERQRLLDFLRPHYWLTEGATEAGANFVFPDSVRLRGFLTGILNRADVAVVHPRIRAAVQALDHGECADISEFVRNVRLASGELRRDGLDPGLRHALDSAAQVAGRFRRGIRPVLAIRRVPRRVILRETGGDDAGLGLVAETAVSDVLALAEELRESEFFRIFLLDRVPLARPAAAVVVPSTPRDCAKLGHSLSAANSFLFSREQSRRMNRVVHDYLPNAERGRTIVGFFPGLGSRAFYQNLGRGLLDSGVSEVTDIYQESARALGFPGRPEKLLLIPENIPTGKMVAQGFIGAAFLVHSLAIEAHLRATARDTGLPVRFLAYTGESFGIITAAVAGGALSIADGVKLGQAFTPLMLTVAERLVPEPHHVLGLRGEPAQLEKILTEIARTYPKTDVEIHKFYSRRQTNVYVRAGVKPGFDLFAAKFPAVEVTELKEATTFLAHAERMNEARQAFEEFMTDNEIVFRTPHTPVISNNDSGLLTTAAEVRAGVLAITDEIMASRDTVETLADLRPDVALELGLGNKSVQLLIDNDIDVPVTSYAGPAGEGGRFLRAVRLVDTLFGELEELHAPGSRLVFRHYQTSREIVRLSETIPFCERYFAHTIWRAIRNAILHRDRTACSAFHQLLEIYQHTANYRKHIDVPAGELVLQARLKKRLAGQPDRIGQVYAELKVLDAAGSVSDRSTLHSGQHEATVFHFDRRTGLDQADLVRDTRLLLDTQPLARRIYEQVSELVGVEDGEFLPGDAAASGEQVALSQLVYQYVLFQLLRVHRPAMFLHGYYLAGGDAMGWLVALAVSGAATLPDVLRLYSASLRSGVDTAEAKAALDRVTAALTTPDAPIISPDGIPVRARIDLEATTRAVFH
ncbi:ACP S-malonyltransferase [Amycolatopsis pithecellobii]|uniref:ACP S-malonyltransferase n=1 Tax=Amycolatopsis pithecellobii TaxID=664692 RepID=UPI001AA046D0|nr:ACP S-malonyltransferase [Amycolatopsis pithecellobii]